MLLIGNKLSEIVSGWKNLVWETREIRVMAGRRAKVCAGCEHAKEMAILDFIEDDVKEIKGMACGLCSCPLSALLRSPKSKCEVGKWGEHIPWVNGVDIFGPKSKWRNY